jgi:transcriptional regulator with XRE-family HTH domain
MSGKVAREKPERLPEKLLHIRSGLRLSQNGMLRALDLEVDRSAISGYELGTREPTLITLLKYARLAGVHVDVLIDDEMGLPKKFLK